MRKCNNNDKQQIFVMLTQVDLFLKLIALIFIFEY